MNPSAGNSYLEIIRMMSRTWLYLLALLLISSCAVKVNKVEINPSRLTEGDSIDAVQCKYGLIEVLDMRPSGDRAGGLGNNMLILSDLSGAFSTQLYAAGLSAGSLQNAPDVRIEIKRFYLSSGMYSKVPVMVLQAYIGQSPPILVRVQPTSMNWWGSADEATSAMAETLHIATNQLVAELNGKCGSV